MPYAARTRANGPESIRTAQVPNPAWLGYAGYRSMLDAIPADRHDRELARFTCVSYIVHHILFPLIP